MWNLIAGSFTNNVLFRSFVIRYCTMKRVTLTGSCTGIRQGKSPFPICPFEKPFDEYFKRKTAETVFEKAGKKITPKLLLEAIRTLPEEKRKAVLLYYFEGMNDTEIPSAIFSRSETSILSMSAFITVASSSFKP